ncbi:MAG: iron-containing alcohol dehydrogenase [Elusimicrobiota bacterium]|jgi:alcohol dehydrogenase YqhD (iron-dependent ADH family)|nr:iron-containing alcohol dehydrogenase [Elusimicrobiota bacterium]
MNNFEFYCPTKIYFGKGEHKKIGELVKKYSSNILLHYGSGSIKKSGLYDEVLSSLKSAGVNVTELGGVQPNPLLSLAKQGIKTVKEKGIDFILAVGGGSAIDSAKCIAAGAKYDGDVWDFYIGKSTIKAALPVATILTIPAAGSENSAFTVITNDENRYKIGLPSDFLRPVFSVLNPELCFTLPPIQRANGICDMMAHIFERYFTNTKNSEVGDKLCEGALKAIINNGPKVIKKADDYDAWAEIMWAGTLAHNGLLGCGRQEDWASHGMGHAVSAIFDIAHGSSLSIMFPAWMKTVYKVNLEMFVQYAVKVWGISDSIRDDKEAIILKAICKTEKFFKSLGLPIRLSEMGVKESDLPKIAENALGAAGGAIGGFKQFTKKEEVAAIYKTAL